MKYKFKTETDKMLKIVTNSLYSNKDIFLRELISNASDALDKLRYAALSEPELVGEDIDLKIKIEILKKEKLIVVSDNGIGMSKQELIENLGTIAKSGTQKFMQDLENMQDDKGTVDLIGQFGVGFYSAFMVADEITVHSKSALENEPGHSWTSEGEGSFHVKALDEECERGTKIRMHIKPDQEKFLDKYSLKHVIESYSSFTQFPIELIDDESGSEDLNTNPALWTKHKNEISHEEHVAFFKSVSGVVSGDPCMTIHYKVEGMRDYTVLLYMPSEKPFDLFNPDRRTSVKLYINRVFITEDNIKLIPQWMRFLRGVVDCPDLPLNISRESTQSDPLVANIRENITSRILSELEKKSISNAEEHTKFWNNFGAVMKEGLCEFMHEERRQSLLKVCRFYSTHGDELISLEDYVSRMQEGQTDIFYLLDDSLSAARNNPQLDGFTKRGLEILLMPDHVDRFWATLDQKYKSFSLKAITRSDIDLQSFKLQDQNDKDKDSVEMNDDASITKFIEYVKQILDNKVKEVKVSQKLFEHPVCLAVEGSAMDIRMERFMIEQNQLKEQSPKIFEINPKHSIVTKLIKTYTADGANENLEECIKFMFDQACIIEGQQIANTTEFVKRGNRMLEMII